MSFAVAAAYRRLDVEIWHGLVKLRWRADAERQRRWSKALVQHGADPGMALARVLAVPEGAFE
jgi:hypothetical protein